MEPSGAEARIVAGMGCRGAAGADELIGLLAAALDAAGLRGADLAFIATREGRVRHPGLLAAADRFGVALRGLPDPVLAATPAPRSDRVMALAGIGSVAEAAVLAHGTMIGAVRRSANATCALGRLR